jgi:hypothetical protein
VVDYRGYLLDGIIFARPFPLVFQIQAILPQASLGRLALAGADRVDDIGLGGAAARSSFPGMAGEYDWFDLFHHLVAVFIS